MKIGFNIKKIINSIANHETRITTLENNAGSGGISSSVFYLFNDYLYKDANGTTKVTVDEFSIASASTILTILDMSDMKNFGVYTPLFTKSTVDNDGYQTIKVFIMLENGTLKGAYTEPNDKQSGVQ